MKVKELIAELQKYDEDMLVAIYGEIFDSIEVSKQTWIDSNYPYDKPDVEYINLI